MSHGLYPHLLVIKSLISPNLYTKTYPLPVLHLAFSYGKRTRLNSMIHLFNMAMSFRPRLNQLVSMKFQ